MVLFMPNAVLLKGVKPVFADIDPKTLNISYKKSKNYKKTKAIYVIHYGEIHVKQKNFSTGKKKKDLSIEDAAHHLWQNIKKNQAQLRYRYIQFS